MNVREIREFIRAENKAWEAAMSVPPPTPRKLTPEEMAAIGMPHHDLVALLAAQYDESQIALGLARTEIVEIFVSPAGTWTLVSTSPDNTSCIVGAGTNWMQVDFSELEGERG